MKKIILMGLLGLSVSSVSLGMNISLIPSVPNERKNSKRIIQRLLQEDDLGWSGIYLWPTHLEGAQNRLSQGVSPKTLDSLGHNLLHTAAICGANNTVLFVLQNNLCSIHDRTLNQETPLDLALMHQNFRTAAILLRAMDPTERSRYFTPEQLAVLIGDLDEVKRCINSENVNTVIYRDGLTLLHLAVYRNNIKILK